MRADKYDASEHTTLQRPSLYLPSSSGLKATWEKYNGTESGQANWPELSIDAVNTALEEIQEKKIGSITALFNFLCDKRSEIAKLLKHGEDLTAEDINAAASRNIVYGSYGIIRSKGLVTIMSSNNQYGDQLKIFSSRIKKFASLFDKKNKDINVEVEKEGEYTMYSVTFSGQKIATYECSKPILGRQPTTGELHIVEYLELTAGQTYTDRYSSITMLMNREEIIEIQIEHADSSNFQDIFKYLDKLGEPLFSDKTLEEPQKYQLLAEIQWYLSQTAFCELGSASINILIDRTLTMFLGLPLLDYKSGTPIDLEAISTTREEFINSYMDMYQTSRSSTLTDYKGNLFSSFVDGGLPVEGAISHSFCL